MSGALDGIRVLDFTSVVSGPFSTRLLADCGAEVVKVEPEGGDMLRKVPPQLDGESRYFAAYNCGKKSVVLNLKDPDDVATAVRLASACDVLVENYRPGVMARLGLGYETLRKLNERLVYASLSGFGQHGPLAESPAYGPIVQAMSGYEQAWMSYQGSDRAELPPFVGVQIADVISGAFTFAAIQTALLKRERHGQGDWVDVSLIESVLALTTAELQFAQTGFRPSSTFRPIPVKDGYLMVAAVSPANLQAICTLLGPAGKPLPFPQGAEQTVELMEELAKWAKDRTAQECQECLNEHGVPVAKYQSPEEILRNEHLLARGSFAELKGTSDSYLINNAPFRFRNARSEIRVRAPRLGEHQEEILSVWLGS